MKPTEQINNNLLDRIEAALTVASDKSGACLHRAADAVYYDAPGVWMTAHPLPPDSALVTDASLPEAEAVSVRIDDLASYVANAR